MLKETVKSKITMGNDSSLPAVDMKPELGMFCISFRPSDKIELIHAPPTVEACVKRIADQVNGLYARRHLGRDSYETPRKYKLGVLQFTMMPLLFNTEKLENGKEEATLGKLLCIWLLEELHKMGYDLQIGSDLTRKWRAAGTLFFRKGASERPSALVVCVAPEKWDTITLLNHSESVKTVAEKAIKDTWPPGIQRQEKHEVFGHTVHDIKMNDNPWRGWHTDNNRIINKLVGNLSKINLRLVGGINMEGGTDSLFFIGDPHKILTNCDSSSCHPLFLAKKRQDTEFSSISLCQINQLWLVGCKEESQCVREAIVNSGFKIKDEHDSKMVLDGSPWYCSGAEAVKTRRLVVRISQAMLQRGWAVIDVIDISRRACREEYVHQKYHANSPLYVRYPTMDMLSMQSMLLFRRCVPTTATFSCVCLTDKNHLCLINFSLEDQEVLKTCITENYPPGAWRCGVTISETEGNCLLFHLKDKPWSNHGSGLHARSLLCHLFVAAINLGFQIVASADVSSQFAMKNSTEHDPDELISQPDYPKDVHSIYLVKMPLQGNELPTRMEQDLAGPE